MASTLAPYVLGSITALPMCDRGVAMRIASVHPFAPIEEMRTATHARSLTIKVHLHDGFSGSAFRRLDRTSVYVNHEHRLVE